MARTGNPQGVRTDLGLGWVYVRNEQTNQLEAFMSDDRTEPSEATDAVERVDEHSAHEADRLATPEEEAAADKARAELGDDEEQVAEHYKDMAEKGANIKGEGEIS
jgi:hypothetical protein